MSDFYFCVFCDTIVLLKEQLSEHLITHFGTSDENEWQKTITKSEANYIENSLIEYQKELNSCFQLMPKELPKDNVSRLLIGCPVCDAIINCFQLIVKKDKNRCVCGEVSEDMDVFQCVDCKQMFHSDCIQRNQFSDENKCLDCLSRNFEISYLKCQTTAEQREHCYKHFDYYPFTCRIDSCGERFFTINSSKTHLETEHNMEFDKSVEICNVLSECYDYEPIEQIDHIIENRLNGKYFLQINNNKNKNESSLSLPPIIDCYKTGDETNGSSKRKNNKSFEYSSKQFIGVHQDQSPVGLPLKKVSNRCFIDFDEQSLSDVSDATFEDYEIETPVRPSKQALNRFDSYSVITESDNSITDNSQPINEIFTHESHSDNWFRQTKATKFPYFPQKDDEVVYIPFGHDLYKEEILRIGLYNQSNKGNSIRFYKNDIIYGKVIRINFCFKQKRNRADVRLVYITLKPDDRKYGTIIHIKYFDIKNVIDFVVLKEIYESSLEQNWKIGDQFRSIVDDKYWFGTIKGINDAEYSKTSMFKKYYVEWANNETDWLSPWDIDKTDGCLPSDRRKSIRVTDNDRRMFFISPPDEWPAKDEEKECKRIANGLRKILDFKEAKEFGIIDDMNGVIGSRYREKILYPIDLKTIISRVENHYYRRHLAIKYDIKFIESNIRKLIKSVKRDPEFRFDEKVAKRLKYHSKFVTALCLIFIDSQDVKNPKDLYHNIDEYIETHDVKCYSAKRVHLNLKKRHEYLPVPWRRTRDYIPRGRGIRKPFNIKDSFATNPRKSTKIESKPRTSTQSISNEVIIPNDSDTQFGNNSSNCSLEYDSDVISLSDYENDDSEGDPDYTTQSSSNCRKFNLLSDSYLNHKSNRRKSHPKKKTFKANSEEDFNRSDN